ncbi:hypothetical protein ACTXT7_016535 [Hymenolepis weldensis]
MLVPERCRIRRRPISLKIFENDRDSKRKVRCSNISQSCLFSGTTLAAFLRVRYSTERNQNDITGDFVDLGTSDIEEDTVLDVFL